MGHRRVGVGRCRWCVVKTTLLVFDKSHIRAGPTTPSRHIFSVPSSVRPSVGPSVRLSVCLLSRRLRQESFSLWYREPVSSARPTVVIYVWVRYWPLAAVRTTTVPSIYLSLCMTTEHRPTTSYCCPFAAMAQAYIWSLQSPQHSHTFHCSCYIPKTYHFLKTSVCQAWY